MTEDIAPISDDAALPKWPKTIGIISLIYAILGMLCTGVSASASTFLGELFMKMGGLDIEIPRALKILAIVNAVFVLMVGVLMLTGAVALIRYRRVGVKRLKLWAMLRLVLLAVGTVAGVMTLPVQLDMQESIQDVTNKRMRESGRPDLVKDFDEEASWRTLVISTGVMAGVTAIYPLFIGFYLSRSKIAEDIKDW